MSRETDTAPGGKLYDAVVQQGADLARKVRESDGPLHFDATEAETLRVLMYGLHESLSICQQTNYAIAAALYRKNLQTVSHDNGDGSFTVDLVVKAPTDDEETTH